MKEFFDAVDAGGYDRWLLLAGALLFAALWLSQRLLDRSEARRLARLQAQTAFYDAQRRAQENWSEHGASDRRTRDSLMDALVHWERWQGRRVADLEPADATPAEWDAISLMRSLQEADGPQAVM